jgi:hypothetical protein
MPHKRGYHQISNVLHLLKRAHYRMLKNPPVVISLGITSPELNLVRLIDLLGEDLPSMVFSDDAITKMHDSLPMVIFRFEVLLKIDEARKLGWVAYLFPRVLLNEVISHKNVLLSDRVGWFNIAYCHIMKCIMTYQRSPPGSGVKPFGNENNRSTTRRIMFDCKLLMHAANTIAGIVYEITSSQAGISPQWISTVCLEKSSGYKNACRGPSDNRPNY